MSKNKDYIENIEGAERRFLTNPVKHETRMDGEGDDKKETHIIEGYAAMYNQRTNLGWMDEEILPGAFDEVLNDDVRALINHDPTLILARSQNGKGTLSLRLDDKGLIYSYATPDRTYARDLQDAIESGDVSQSSFSFSIEEEIWVHGDDKQNDLRQIKKFRTLFDVSPVTFPAYTDTTVAKRSHANIEKPNPVNNKSFDEYEARQRMLNLNKA